MVELGLFLKCKKQINRTSKYSAFIMSEKAWPEELRSQGFKSYSSLLAFCPEASYLPLWTHTVVCVCEVFCFVFKFVLLFLLNPFKVQI